MDRKLFFFDWLGKLIALSLKSFYADVCLSMNLEGFFFTLHDLFFVSMTRTGKGLQGTVKICHIQYFPSLHTPCIAHHSFTITATVLFK